jgi:hypothetical protein
VKGLTAVGLALCAAAAAPAAAFDSFEHRFIADQAYELASAKYDKEGEFATKLGAAGRFLGFGRVPASAQRMNTRMAELVPLSFGDLASLAGDFTETPEELRLMMQLIGEQLAFPDVADLTDFRQLADQGEAVFQGTRRQWISACNWLYAQRRAPPLPPTGRYVHCFDHLVGGADPTKRVFAFGTIGYRPERHELAEQEGIPGFVELAAKNRSHFPRHSWKAYVDAHRAALKFAVCFREFRAGMRCNMRGERISAGEAWLFETPLLVRMLVHEGFAQHFLHDSFASGHIGTKFGTCGLVMDKVQLHCRPTKARVQQTHDVLNAIGVTVKLVGPDKARGLATGAWTAFGDRHLFTPEADLHRNIVIWTSEHSLTEVLKRASGGDRKQAPDSCEMCSTGTFPVAVEKIEDQVTEPLVAITPEWASQDLAEFERLDRRYPRELSDERSKDPRVPILPVEGWKVGVALAQQYSNDEAVGDNGGMMLRMDYLRNTGPGLNIYGIEYWNFLDRGSVLLGTVGWARPREVSMTQMAAKLKLGLRSEEATTDTGTERRNGVEFSFGADLTYEIYRPIAVFMHIQPLSLFHYSGQYRWEGIFNGGWRFAFGARFDFSGIDAR